MKLFFFGLIRGGIPFLIMSGIALLLNFQSKSWKAKGTFCSALIILIVGASSIIYDIAQWNLLKQSIIHFLLMLVTIYPVLLFSCWFLVHNFKDGLVVFCYFLFVGLILWSLFFTLAKIFNW